MSQPDKPTRVINRPLNRRVIGVFLKHPIGVRLNKRQVADDARIDREQIHRVLNRLVSATWLIHHVDGNAEWGHRHYYELTPVGDEGGRGLFADRPESERDYVLTRRPPIQNQSSDVLGYMATDYISTMGAE